MVLRGGRAIALLPKKWAIAMMSLLEMSGRQCEFTWKSWFSRESLDG
jgi:hypothetical protein